jgi:hypothetical protein
MSEGMFLLLRERNWRSELLCSAVWGSIMKWDLQALVGTIARRVYTVKQNCVITVFRLWTQHYRLSYNVKNGTQLQNVDFYLP